MTAADPWTPLPRTEWAGRIRLCRQRGSNLGWDKPGQPLSEYEACEVCGVPVLAIAKPDGERLWAELTGLAGDPERRSARLKPSGHKHRCGGRS